MQHLRCFTNNQSLLHLTVAQRKIKLSTNKPSKRRREHDVGVQNNFCFATVLDDNKRSFLNK